MYLDNSTYCLTNTHERRPWREARADCAARGACLATLHHPALHPEFIDTLTGVLCGVHSLVCCVVYTPWCVVWCTLTGVLCGVRSLVCCVVYAPWCVVWCTLPGVLCGVHSLVWWTLPVLGSQYWMGATNNMMPGDQEMRWTWTNHVIVREDFLLKHRVCGAGGGLTGGFDLVWLGEFGLGSSGLGSSGLGSSGLGSSGLGSSGLGSSGLGSSGLGSSGLGSSGLGGQACSSSIFDVWQVKGGRDLESCLSLRSNGSVMGLTQPCLDKMQFVCRKEGVRVKFYDEVVSGSHELEVRKNETEVCPINFFYMGGLCYSVSRRLASWKMADRACRAVQGGALASFPTQQHWHYFREYLNSWRLSGEYLNSWRLSGEYLNSWRLSGPTRLWVSLKRSSHEKEEAASWLWAEKEPASPWVWGPGVIFPPGWRCGTLDSAWQFKASPAACSFMNRFLCSAPPTSMPETLPDSDELPENSPCPSGWRFFARSSQCLYVAPAQSDWFNAQATCQAYGGYLYSVGLPMEWTLLASELRALRPEMTDPKPDLPGYWVAASDTMFSWPRQWLWESRQAINWNSWNEFRNPDIFANTSTDMPLNVSWKLRYPPAEIFQYEQYHLSTNSSRQRLEKYIALQDNHPWDDVVSSRSVMTADTQSSPFRWSSYSSDTRYYGGLFTPLMPDMEQKLKASCMYVYPDKGNGALAAPCLTERSFICQTRKPHPSISKETWWVAARECEAHNASLMVLTNLTLWTDLALYAAQTPSHLQRQFWLGANNRRDNGTVGDVAWIHGGHIEPVLWHPMDFYTVPVSDGTPRCVFTDGEEEFKIRTDQCEAERWYLCSTDTVSSTDAESSSKRVARTAPVPEEVYRRREKKSVQKPKLSPFSGEFSVRNRRMGVVSLALPWRAAATACSRYFGRIADLPSRSYLQLLQQQLSTLSTLPEEMWVGGRNWNPLALQLWLWEGSSSVVLPELLPRSLLRSSVAGDQDQHNFPPLCLSLRRVTVDSLLGGHPSPIQNFVNANHSSASSQDAQRRDGDKYELEERWCEAELPVLCDILPEGDVPEKPMCAADYVALDDGCFRVEKEILAGHSAAERSCVWEGGHLVSQDQVEGVQLDRILATSAACELLCWARDSEGEGEDHGIYWISKNGPAPPGSCSALVVEELESTSPSTDGDKKYGDANDDDRQDQHLNTWEGNTTFLPCSQKHLLICWKEKTLLSRDEAKIHDYWRESLSASELMVERRPVLRMNDDSLFLFTHRKDSTTRNVRVRTSIIHQLTTGN
ncbi:C-type lectin-like [Trinorchestia longiramus]|nr:C-type lectin-like [Trinorchestia longiramus]